VDGPLAGLRVLDLTDDSGRLATKLLCECGASVVRIGSGSAGPPMQAADAAALGGLLDWWYDGGKAVLAVDLDTDGGRSDYRNVATRADLIIETQPPGRLRDLGIDHADLVTDNPRLVQVSLTPFGRTGPRAGWQTTDLVAAALGGVLSVSGLPDQPVNPWGRQCFNVAGYLAAVSGLAGVHAAESTGVGQHIDLSLHEAVCTTVEQLFFQYWFDDVQRYPKIAPRQGSLHWIGAYEVVPTASGWLMVTPSPNPLGMLEWMIEEEFPKAQELLQLPAEELLANVRLVMQTIASFALTGKAGALFKAAQDRHIAFGEVQTVAQVAANPQHEVRRLFQAVEWPGTSPVHLPGPVPRFGATPVPPPRGPCPEPADVGTVLAGWTPPRETPPITSTPGKPLAGLRVLDLSHVLAGPFCTRVLGDLGADVIKLATSERATLVNDPGHPYYYVWNRSKRAVSLNMKDAGAVDVVRRLIEHSDVVVENFSAGVLDRWGLSYEDVRAWNPSIVYVTMSGCGHSGPWSNLVTYAPTIHALAGITYLSNPPGRGDVGPGFSLNDHVSGLSAAVAILAALAARGRTGEGQHVDISQLEVGAHLIGPALMDLLTNGREARPAGNADPFGVCVPNDCYRTAEGSWLAVSCRDDDDWLRLAEAIGAGVDPGLATVEGRSARVADVDALVQRWADTVSAAAGQELLQRFGVPAGKVQNAADLMEDPQLVSREMWHDFDHAVFGERPFDRFPAVWSGTTLEPYRPAPAYIGEHNFEVYTGIAGLDEGFVAEGMATGLFT